MLGLIRLITSCTNLLTHAKFSITHTNTLTRAHTHAHTHTQVGLSALVTHSLSDFEEVIVRVAQSPGLLKSLRHHLSATTTRAPLFNSNHFERDVSSAYTLMWEVEATLSLDFYHNSGAETPNNATRKKEFHVVVGGGPGGGDVVQFGSPSSRHSFATSLKRR